MISMKYKSNCGNCGGLIWRMCDLKQNRCLKCRRERQREYCKANPWMSSRSNAKARCRDKSRKNYMRYGGRGIEFKLTLEEMKFMWDRDSAALMKKPSIDRVDCSGHYELGNCRFIEHAENVGRHESLATKCRRGHSYDDKNTATYTRGGRTYRECRICRRSSSQKYNKKRSAMLAARSK